MDKKISITVKVPVTRDMDTLNAIILKAQIIARDYVRPQKAIKEMLETIALTELSKARIYNSLAALLDLPILLAQPTWRIADDWIVIGDVENQPKVNENESFLVKITADDIIKWDNNSFDYMVDEITKKLISL